MSYCAGYCLRQASRHGPFNSVNRLLNGRHSVCIHTQSIGLWCVPIFMTANLTIGETPLNGRVKEQQRNRKEERPKKSLSVLTPYLQTFPIPSNLGRKTIKRRRKWGAHARLYSKLGWNQGQEVGSEEVEVGKSGELRNNAEKGSKSIIYCVWVEF